MIDFASNVCIESTNLAVGDDASVTLLAGDVSGPGNHTVAWSMGDSGRLIITRELAIGGNFEGVDLTLGTSAALSEAEATIARIDRVGRDVPISDDWLLRGYADVDLVLGFFATENATITVRDHASVSSSSATGGSWEIADPASVHIGLFYPNFLLVDGGGRQGTIYG